MEDFNEYMDAFIAPMHQIDEHLFLGGLIGASDKETLTRNRIEAVVQALSNHTPARTYQGIVYHRIHIEDSLAADITPHLVGALKFIKNAHAQGKNVFVHCAAGISRSSSIVTAYLMAKHRLSFADALQQVRSARACAWPNEAFQQQLRALDCNTLRERVGFK